MVALGFGIGLVFGLVTEEPELLGAHLRGESESIQLVEAGAAEETSAREAETGAVILAENDGVDGAAMAAAPNDVYASAAVTTRPWVEPEERAVTKGLPAVAAAEPVRETTVSAAVAVPVSARAVARAERAWAIQVGAFSDEAAATSIYGHISEWTMSQLTNMMDLFSSLVNADATFFNADLSAWDC